jgi:hypothetical protein
VIRARETPTFVAEPRPAEDVAAARAKQDQGDATMHARFIDELELGHIDPPPGVKRLGAT